MERRRLAQPAGVNALLKKSSWLDFFSGVNGFAAGESWSTGDTQLGNAV